MKKFTTIASSLLLFAGALISCQKENLVEPQTVAGPTSFTATLEQNTDPQTKVTIDGYTPKFEVGDELTVMADNSAIATFAVSEVSAAGEATFELKGSWSSSPAAPYTIYNGKPSMSNRNMLAYSAPNTISSAKAMKLDQAIVVGSASELNNVVLKNMCSVIKIVVPDEVKAIKVAPSSGTLWDGAAIMLQTLTASQFPTANAKEITYTGAGETLVAGTYYIPFFPQQFTGGVMVGYTLDGTEYYWKEKKGNFIFQRNKLYDMGSLANWPQPEPKFAVEDLVGTYVGDMKIGLFMGAGVGINGNIITNATNTIEASDNLTNGNVKFTVFESMANAIYAQFDLYTGTVTLAKGQTINYDAGSVSITRDFVLSLNDAKNTLTLAANAAIGPHPALGEAYPVTAEAFTLTKQAAPEPEPEGPTVADFVGKYTGGLKEQAYNGGNPMGNLQDRTEESAHKEFEFKAEDNGSNNVVMTMYFGNTCNVPGYFDVETCEATFAAGAALTFINGAGTTSSPLVLKLSDDFKTLTQVGTLSGSANPPFPWTYEISEISMTKQGGEAGLLELSDVFGYEWAVTYKANGVAKAETSGDNTKFSKQEDIGAAANGCNLYINYFMCGYNTGYANFDVATGTLTIPQAKNSGVLYFPAIDWVGKYLSSDIVMKMSDDKTTIVATGSFELTDGTTISDYTFTRQ